MKVVYWETWGNVIEALERAFLALGNAGGNTANGPYRAEWERARAAIHEAENARTALTAEKVAQARH